MGKDFDFDDLPHYKPSNRFSRPLIETGNREGWEEIRDGGRFLGGKIADGARAVGHGIKRLFGKNKKP